MAAPKKQSYLHGAAILAAGVVIIKILGAVYKIPLYNMIGDEGTAQFGVAYNIYSLLLTISTAGLPIALSRMIAEADTLGRPRQVRRIFNVALATFMVLGFVCSAVMFLFPNQLATIISGKDTAGKSILALSPAVFFVCLISAYRGYTQGHSNMIPTSISQIIEVVCKLIFGLSLAYLALKLGKGISMAAAGAIAGVSIGSIIAAVYLFIVTRPQLSERIPDSCTDTADPSGRIFATLIKIGVPIALGSCLLNVINLVDTHQVIDRLQHAAGYSAQEADILYGAYFKVQTLFNLPAAFIVPLTTSIIPAIAAYRTKGDYKGMALVSESSMRITTLFALPMGIGLSVLSYPIVNVLYPTINSSGPGLLAIFGIAAYFVCFAQMTTAILQASGHEKLSICIMPVGGIVKIAINWVLIGNPKIGIYGATIGTLACYVVMCLANVYFIMRFLPEKPKLFRVFIKPLIASIIMGAAAWAVYSLLHKMLPDRLLMLAGAMIVGVVVGIVIYAVLIIALRAITLDDVGYLPKGEKIAKLLRLNGGGNGKLHS
ncbi:MAG: polysaccharide biosynthesis protein [Oscillospiraceae bacterium]|nr:polysaccharide biosynthesis protein [Oscillospiraceae bacterium]